MSASRRGSESVDGMVFENGLPSVVVAAHELKAPLALVRQLSLSLENGDMSIDEQKLILRQISLTSEKALRLTSDLTKSIRLKDALFNLEPINPLQLCEDVIHELQPMFKAKERNLKLIPNRKSLLVVSNRDLLKRVIMNFSDNALHYSEDNSDIEIKVKTIKKGEMVRLGVRDYGPALPSNFFKNIKDKIPGSVVPQSSRPQSSGLGLYIVSQFADAINGEVGVVRHRDGATFYIDLPASSQLSLL